MKHPFHQHPRQPKMHHSTKRALYKRDVIIRDLYLILGDSLDYHQVAEELNTSLARVVYNVELIRKEINR